MSASAKLDIRTQGRELAEELDLPSGPLVSRAAASPPPVPPPAMPADGSGVVLERPEWTPNSVGKKRGALDDLAQDKVTLVPLNVRVPEWVFIALEKRVLEIKHSGRKIKKEDVVTEAIVGYMGLKRPK